MSHSTPEEQRFWANLLVPAISRLLDHAGTYSNEEMEAQVGFVQHHATAWLGRTRQTRSAKDGAETPLTVNSALETSLNFSAEGNTMVRFQFEPMTAQRWVEGDSFGRNATYEMLESTKALASGVDLRWTERLIDGFYPETGEETRVLLAKTEELPEPLDHAPMLGIAFDLHGGARTMKTYFLPIGKVMATGLSNESITFRALSLLDPYGEELKPAIQRVEQYLSSAQNPMTIDLVGIDAVDPDCARLKVYAHLLDNSSWAAVCDVFTLGGQAPMDEERTEALRLLRSIWHRLLDLEHPLDDEASEVWSKAPKDPQSFFGHLQFSFEMKHGQDWPLVKIYVPVWQYAPSDRQIADNLTACFGQLGWHDASANYLPRLRQTYPGAELDGEPPALLHSNVSFTYSHRSGAYMSVYHCVSTQALNVDGA